MYDAKQKFVPGIELIIFSINLKPRVVFFHSCRTLSRTKTREISFALLLALTSSFAGAEISSGIIDILIELRMKKIK